MKVTQLLFKNRELIVNGKDEIEDFLHANLVMGFGKKDLIEDGELNGILADRFPSAEIVLEFINPSDGGEGGSMFPTGQLVDDLDVPGVGVLKATMITAGIPTVFVNAHEIGYTGTELREAINTDAAALEKLEKIRVAGALRMGLIQHPDEALTRQHTPKVAFVAPPQAYVSSSGKTVAADEVDLLVRALSMG